MGKPLFFVFDVETSGLDPNTCEILSLAARLLDRDLLEVGSMFQYAFPEKPVDPEAARINGYTKELWTSRFAGSQQNLLEQVRKFLTGQKRLLPVGHNVTFDLRFLKALFISNAASADYKEFFSYHAIDTLGTTVMVDIAQRSTPQGSYSLSNLSERFGISLGDKAHDVEEDVKATVALFRILAEQIRGQLLLPEAPATTRMRKGPFMKKNADDTWILLYGKHQGKSLDYVAGDRGYLQYMLEQIKDLSEEAREAIVLLKNVHDS